MKISNNTMINKTADIPLEKLASLKGVDEKNKLDIASRHFETMFLKLILQETQKPVIKSNLVSNSTRNEIYRDLMVTTLAEAISETQPLKIGSMIQQKLLQNNQEVK